MQDVTDLQLIQFTLPPDNIEQRLVAAIGGLKGNRYGQRNSANDHPGRILQVEGTIHTRF